MTIQIVPPTSKWDLDYKNNPNNWYRQVSEWVNGTTITSPVTGDWILTTGYWDDDNVWKDTEIWID